MSDIEVVTSLDLGNVEGEMIAALQSEVAARTIERNEWMKRFCHLAIAADGEPTTILIRANLTADEVKTIQSYWFVSAPNVRMIVLPDKRDAVIAELTAERNNLLSDIQGLQNRSDDVKSSA